MRVLAIALAATLAGSGLAMADENDDSKQDMSKLTCSEFVEMSAPDAIVTLFWIDGYLTTKDGAPVWDRETFVEHRDKLITICTAEDGKDKLVMEEVDNLS